MENRNLKPLERPAREIADKVKNEAEESGWPMTPESFQLIVEIEKNIDGLEPEHTGINAEKLTIFKDLLLEELKNEVDQLFLTQKNILSLDLIRETVKATVDLELASYILYGFYDSLDFQSKLDYLLDDIDHSWNNFPSENMKKNGSPYKRIGNQSFITDLLPGFELPPNPDYSDLFDSLDNWETNISRPNDSKIENLCDPSQTKCFDINLPDLSNKRTGAQKYNATLEKSNKTKKTKISPTEKKFLDSEYEPRRTNRILKKIEFEL